MSAAGTSSLNPDDYLYLLGGTPLEEYLAFMTKEPLDAATANRKRLTAAWRAVDTIMQGVRRHEPEWADFPPLQPMPAELQALVAEVKADPIFERSFAPLPRAFAVVELDRLVVRQKTINLAQVRRLQDRLGSSPSPETVFRLCLPFDHPTVPPRSSIFPDGTIDFASLSNDLRFLEAVVLQPEQVRDYLPLGPVAGIVGLVVGYGSNYLNAIAAEGRLVLHNGCHRAYALRALGLTHVPMVIQHARTREELLQVAGGALRRDPDRFLGGPRPPVLKDYFNPELYRRVQLAPVVRHVQVRYTFEEFDRAEAWDPS